MDLPTKCPRCESGNTVHIESVDVSTCLECGLDWWYSPRRRRGSDERGGRVRSFVRTVLIWATIVLVVAIVFFPSSVNGEDFLLYAGLWIVGWWVARE